MAFSGFKPATPHETNKRGDLYKCFAGEVNAASQSKTQKI